MEPPQFKVVVAFDDTAHRESALQTCDYVIQQLGDGVAVSRKSLDLGREQDSRKLAAAAKDAARADMIIVSTGKESKLSSQMKRWMDRWSGKRAADEGALVAILSPGGAETGNGALAELASVAKLAKMDFFSSEVAAY